MDKLSNIFGNTARVKLLRLFLFNETQVFSLEDIKERSGLDNRVLKKEIISLEKTECIKRKIFTKESIKKKGKKEIKVSKKMNGYIYDADFLYGDSLRHLFSLATISTHDDLAKKISTIGRVKFLVVAGVFIKDTDSRVDLLVAGDGLSAKRMETVAKNLETEIGKEITYSIFETQDFMYRLGLYDKLIRDILDFPHKTLINKLGIEG
ncbi:MAG: hypothetical protein Q7R78_02285 [bacterium]|nr:hypothetical protein [bacterium]